MMAAFAGRRLEAAICALEALLKLVGAHGCHLQTGPLAGASEWCSQDQRLRSLHRGPQVTLEEASPCLVMTESQAEGARYLHVDVLQAADQRLPWGVDCWVDGKKVLNLEWSESGNDVRIVTFRRGRWEQELRALALSLPEARS